VQGGGGFGPKIVGDKLVNDLCGLRTRRIRCKRACARVEARSRQFGGRFKIPVRPRGVTCYGLRRMQCLDENAVTAYAHNQSLLVKEDQVVRRGQKIAEMGSSDAERVQLHFEIRRLGRPIDPARLLPTR
jgi:hypothetical protein